MAHNLRRDLGVVESYAALLGILIGAGIFKVTGVAWELTGPSVILGYLVLAPAILATSVAYAVFVSTPMGREPGGEYNFGPVIPRPAENCRRSPVKSPGISKSQAITVFLNT